MARSLRREPIDVTALAWPPLAFPRPTLGRLVGSLLARLVAPLIRMIPHFGKEWQ